MTPLLTGLYLGWTYFDGRHAVEPGKKVGFLKQLQFNRVVEAHGVDIDALKTEEEKNMVRAAHRSRLIGILVLLLVMW